MLACIDAERPSGFGVLANPRSETTFRGCDAGSESKTKVWVVSLLVLCATLATLQHTLPPRPAVDAGAAATVVIIAFTVLALRARA